MQKKLNLAVLALCCAPYTYAQTGRIDCSSDASAEAALTFTENQLGYNDDMPQDITIVNSINNVYSNQVSRLFSPVHFRYRAFNPKYQEVHVNGLLVNDMESGQFGYRQTGSLGNVARNMECVLPFEASNFAFTGMGGSNNYDFRPSASARGHHVTVSGANRNYTLRGIYTYSTGLSRKGWAFTGSAGYRWASNGYVEGTSYKSLSYFLAVQKVWDRHSLSLSAWGSPTKHSAQGAATDEAYTLAGSHYYNPYWGYQDGKKRNSRMMHDFSPSAILTWDWRISDKSKLTTSFFGKYSMRKSTRLNYNNADNPLPSSWLNMPSSLYDIWHTGTSTGSSSQALDDYNKAVDHWRASKSNRQINWDRLYSDNQQANAQGGEALYYIGARHDNNLMFSLASTFNHLIDKNKRITLGFAGATNKAMHYQTMDDMLGANTLTAVNTYALGRFYGIDAPEVQYDLNNPNAKVGKGDRFGYDYNTFVNKARVWGCYTESFGPLNYTVAAKLGYTSMQRDGKMRNGFAADNSFGKSSTKDFLNGGLKFGSRLVLGHGGSVSLGVGYEHRAPEARTVFVAPEVSNAFVDNLKSERVFSAELGYGLRTSWLSANISAYYSRTTNVADWQKLYYDDENSFSYVSMTGMKKEYYGLEAGMKFKVASALDVNVRGTLSQAKVINNAKLAYMNSFSAAMHGDGYTGDNADRLYSKGMHDYATPLTAASLGVSYHRSGWLVCLNANYYDRIYLAWSPSNRFASSLKARDAAARYNGESVLDSQGNPLPSALSQAKGKGGFMLDGTIGRSISLKRGSLAINLSVANILNNRNIVTGGYEQSVAGGQVQGANAAARAYSFQKNPMKFYAYGANGMLDITYNF